MKIRVKICFVILFAVTALTVVRCGMFGSDKRFAYGKPSQLSRIEIVSDSLVSILENINGSWIVNGDYPANKNMIDNLQLIISKIKVEYPLPKMYAQALPDSLIMARGMHVKLFSKEDMVRDYFLFFADSLGCVGLINNHQQAYALHMPGYTINPCAYVNADYMFWLDNVVFSYYPKDIVSIEVENKEQPDQSFRIENNSNGNYKLIDIYRSKAIENPKTMVIRRYLTYFTAITFDHYAKLSATEKESLLASDYPYILTVESKKEKNSYKIMYMPLNSNELDVYGKPLKYDRHHFYLSLNNGQGIAIASWITFDILLKNLSDFVNK